MPVSTQQRGFYPVGVAAGFPATPAATIAPPWPSWPLPAGLYHLQARATLGGQAQQDAGELLVQAQPLEALESKADHNLLAKLSRRSGSRLYYPAQIDKLAQDIITANYEPVISVEEDLKDLINLKWIFFVILTFLTVEWAVRKYSGSVASSFFWKWVPQYGRMAVAACPFFVRRAGARGNAYRILGL